MGGTPASGRIGPGSEVILSNPMKMIVNLFCDSFANAGDSFDYGEPGSGTMQVNGAAAHLTSPGHNIIGASFRAYDESDLVRYSPVVVHVHSANRAFADDSHPQLLPS